MKRLDLSVAAISQLSLSASAPCTLPRQDPVSIKDGHGEPVCLLKKASADSFSQFAFASVTERSPSPVKRYLTTLATCSG